MAKTKKGRSSNNSSDKKRGPTPRTRSRAEKTTENEPKSIEIDVSTLADDDPVPATRRSPSELLALMGDSSSDEASFNTPVEDTPRRGDNKKKQRFSEVHEVIEIEKAESTEESIQSPPAPRRVMDLADEDSTQSSQVVTIADILGEGPEETVRFHQPLIIAKDCRYTFQVKIAACENPFQSVVATFIGFLKWLQNKVGKDLAIATWDDAEGKEKTYSKIQHLPKNTDTTSWTSIWGNWIITVNHNRTAQRSLKYGLLPRHQRH